MLSSATTRMDAFIDRTLALSNASQLVAYITGGKAKERLTGKSLVRVPCCVLVPDVRCLGVV